MTHYTLDRYKISGDAPPEVLLHDVQLLIAELTYYLGHTEDTEQRLDRVEAIAVNALLLVIALVGKEEKKC